MHIHSAWSALDYDPTTYAGHNYWIGAATICEIEDSAIKALGKWKSDVFQAYVKILWIRLCL